MIDDILSRMFAQEWVALLFIAILLLALAEAGFRLGLRGELEGLRPRHYA